MNLSYCFDKNQQLLTSKFIILIFANNIDADITKYCVNNVYWPDKEKEIRWGLKSYILLWNPYEFQK